MYETNPLTGMLQKIGKTASRIMPIFAPPKETNINPAYNRGTPPRRRHFKRVGPRRLIMPSNVYTKKELATQKERVANYHEGLNTLKQRQLLNQAKKIDRHLAIIGRQEFKANKPVFE